MKFRMLPLLFLLAAPAAHGAYVISQPDTNATFGNAATGQSFTPSMGMVDDPGASTATIDLTSFSLWSNGGSGAGNGNLNNVYLLIYDANPNPAVGSANLLGASTNFIDHSPNLAQGSQMTWTFNNLTLNYTTTYFAVLASTTDGSLGINDVGVALQVSNSNPYNGGTGLINDFSVASTQDAKFSATFVNPVAVPEPSAALLGGLGMLALLRRRRD